MGKENTTSIPANIKDLGRRVLPYLTLPTLVFGSIATGEACGQTGGPHLSRQTATIATPADLVRDEGCAPHPFLVAAVPGDRTRSIEAVHCANNLNYFPVVKNDADGNPTDIFTGAGETGRNDDMTSASDAQEQTSQGEEYVAYTFQANPQPGTFTDVHRTFVRYPRPT